ncbi:MAG: BrnT family toxin [Spirochaetaceae bacterium]|jgi:uncharacterized DUF497 family protein|nr:BrnT family toxin [Spirochaetaceae bacterium]
MLELKGKSIVWDEPKNRKNLRDHGITFTEAAMAIIERSFEILYDENHSSLDETRWMGLGMVNHSLFALCFVERGDELRLYSARKAVPKEKRLYNDHINQIFGA